MPYFVKISGKKSGPLNSNNLKAIAADGTLSRQDLVSKDNTNWITAGNVKGLEFPPAERPAARRAGLNPNGRQ